MSHHTVLYTKVNSPYSNKRISEAGKGKLLKTKQECTGIVWNKQKEEYASVPQSPRAQRGN